MAPEIFANLRPFSALSNKINWKAFGFGRPTQKHKLHAFALTSTSFTFLIKCKTGAHESVRSETVHAVICLKSEFRA